MTATDDPYIGVQLLSFVHLASDLPSGFFSSRQHERVDFLVCNRFENFAVCLELANDFRAFELDGVNDAWIGCIIKNVELQADIESRFTENEKSFRSGDLVVANNAIFIATRPAQRGHPPYLVKWSEISDVGKGVVSGGFSRWRIVRVENDIVHELKRIDSEAKAVF